MGSPLSVYVVKLSDQSCVQVTPVSGQVHNFDPAWSPDGQYLVFASTRGKTGTPVQSRKRPLQQSDLWRVRVEVRNVKSIPTRAAVARQKGMGLPDRFTISPRNGKVLAGGRRLGSYGQEQTELVENRPERLLIDGGIKGNGRLRVEWLLSCPAGRPDFGLRYEAEKGGVLER